MKKQMSQRQRELNRSVDRLARILKPARVKFGAQRAERRAHGARIAAGLTAMVLAVAGLWGAAIWRIGTGEWPL